MALGAPSDLDAHADPPLYELFSGNLQETLGYWPESGGAGSLKSFWRTTQWLLQCIQRPEVATSGGAGGGSWVGALQDSLDVVVPLCQELKEASEELLAIASTTRTASSEAEDCLSRWLQRWVGRLDALDPGQVAATPIAWADDRARLHAAVAIVHKESFDSGSILIVNVLGSGSDRHPQATRGPSTCPERCVSPVRIDSVLWSRLSNSAFWLVMFRPILDHFGGDEPHPSLLYEAVLPFLNRRSRDKQLSGQMQQESEDARYPLPFTDNTLIHTLLHTVGLVLQLSLSKDGEISPYADRWKWTMLWLHAKALQLVVPPTPISRTEGRRGSAAAQKRASLAVQGCRFLARLAAAVGRSSSAATPARSKERGLSYAETIVKAEPRVARWQSAYLEHLSSWIKPVLAEHDRLAAAHQVLPDAPKDWTANQEARTFGGFERLAGSVDVSEFVGELETTDVVLPVPLVQLPATVDSYHDVVLAVQGCVRMCSLLANQHTRMPNAYHHIVALIQHLLFEVLPVPLPLHQKKEACFWRKHPLEHETRTCLLSETSHLIRYLVAASLSLRRTPHLHAVRLLSLAAATAILDAIARRVPPTFSTELARIYSGELREDLKCACFGLAPVKLAEETKSIPLQDPVTVLLRTRLLDYFGSACTEFRDLRGQPEAGKVGRVVFGFANYRLDSNDEEFLHRLALLGAFAHGSEPDRRQLSSYLAGESPDFLLRFPALEALRDASFLLRYFCVPLECLFHEEHRSDGRPWRSGDAALHWSYSPDDDAFTVVGFQRELTFGRSSSKAAAVTSQSFFTRLFGSVKQEATYSSRRQAVSLSSAAALSGQTLNTEEDVLHAEVMPTFDGLLSPTDSEALLTYVTVPYLRIPLVLRFFNDRTRLGALSSPQLQSMLDSILFEPGPFCSSSAPVAECPVQVPCSFSSTDTAVATPSGRLIRELVFSPQSLQRELDGIFRLAMERDMPVFTPAASAVLYVVRLWARIVAFTRSVARHSQNKVGSRVRGFSQASQDVARALETAAQNWDTRLRLEALPTLERWCKRATEDATPEGVEVARTMWLHLSLIYRWSEELSLHSVSTLLCAEAYLNANPAKAEPLGFQHSEVFEVFHATRPRIYSWLKRRPAMERSQVLEHVVRVVASSRLTTLLEGGASLGRNWRELSETWDGMGRFAPSQVAPVSAVQGALADSNFSQWLAACVDSAPIEVNLNIGQLQFRQHTVTPVPKQVLSLPEFKEVFPGIDQDAAGLMWALVEKAPQRERYRFAGLGYEFRLWKSGVQRPSQRSLFPRNFKNDRGEGERWVLNALLAVPAINDLWQSWGCYAPEELQTGSVARLLFQDGKDDDYGSTFQPALRGRSLSDEKWNGAGGSSSCKEVEVFKSPATGAPVLHVFDLLTCGPWTARTQVFSSDPSWSYCVRNPDASSFGGAEGSISPVRAPSRSNAVSEPEAATIWSMPSLEIVHEDSGGESVLVPCRFLKGALPDCLLDLFHFWRGQPGHFVGKMKVAAREEAGSAVALVVSFSAAAGLAAVVRIALDTSTKMEEEKQVGRLLHPVAQEAQLLRGQVLVDLLRAPKTSKVGAVACWALQLDDLSHTLAWTRGEVQGNSLLPSGSNSAANIEVMEFPRLGLTFSSSTVSAGLCCDQHGGRRVVEGPVKDPSLLALLRPFPKFVLLEDSGGQLFALVSLADRPAIDGSGQVQLIRNDDDWLENLPTEQRHQAFVVHSSNEMLFAPTLLSQLYLMLLHILQGMYGKACDDAATCFSCKLPTDPAEKFIWEEVCATLRQKPSVDAAVLRLKLMLQLHRQGRGPPDGWDLEQDLLLWSRFGVTHSSVASRLAVTEDAALLDLCSSSPHWELKARRETHRKSLRLFACRGHCTHGPPFAPMATATGNEGQVGLTSTRRSRSSWLAGWDAMPSQRVVLDDIHVAEGLKLDESTKRLLAEAEPPPEDRVALRAGQAFKWLLRRLPLKLPDDFVMLYELLTGVRQVRLSATDNHKLMGELLICLLSPSALKNSPVLASVLRGLEYYDYLADRFPRYGGDMKTFTEELAASLQEHGQSLLPVHHRNSAIAAAPAAEIETSASVWDTQLDMMAMARSRSRSGELPSPAIDVTDGNENDDESDDEVLEMNAQPLTNDHLSALLECMLADGDRRLPSLVWDFNCEASPLVPRQPGDTFETAIEELSRRLPELSFPDLKLLAQRPLGFVKDTLWLTPLCLKTQRGDSSNMDLASLERCGSMQTAAGRKIIKRMRSHAIPSETDEESNSQRGQLFEVLADMQRIDQALQSLQEACESLRRALASDEANMTKAVQTTVALVNGWPVPASAEAAEATMGEAPSTGGGRGEKSRKGAPEKLSSLALGLAQLGGRQAVWTFQDFLQMSLVKGGIDALMQLLPEIPSRDMQDASASCSLAMLLSSRMVLARRCLASLEKLALMLKEARNDKAYANAAKRGSQKTGKLQLFARTMNTVLTAATGRGSSSSAGAGTAAVGAKEGGGAGAGGGSAAGAGGAGGEERASWDKAQERALAIAETAEQILADLRAGQPCLGKGKDGPLQSDMDDNDVQQQQQQQQTASSEGQAEDAGAVCDPRLLCFEFVSRLALRPKQVNIVHQMLSAVRGRQPLVRQMLMGEGKTTVVTPLVVLLAATASRACVVCCPAAILEFTCQVLRQRLHSVLARPVTIFSFTRSDEVSDDLYLRLLFAQDARAALCAGPMALKSLLLRFLLTVHNIDKALVKEDERAEAEDVAMPRFAPLKYVLKWTGLAASGPSSEAQQELERYRYEAEVLGLAFQVFRGAVLLLDDIDLLMHPLRSELHWPLGESHQLDYTEASSGHADLSGQGPASSSYLADSVFGTRWQIAFHLLDGFYSCQLSPGPAVTLFASQSAAPVVLQKLKDLVERGLLEKHLQASPHLTLLSPKFYEEELRPVLAEWLLLWLRRRQPIALSKDILLDYLCGKKVDAKSKTALEALADQQLKALNLSRSWLMVLMPHITSRIHRVHYGLLDEDAPSWKFEPRARRHFAVPFVGKDAPSDSSQFSHPDVVIGLTWLSYRLCGLRTSDFDTAMSKLLRQQRNEVEVAPRFRRAHRLYNAWVSAANGFVRGGIESDLTDDLPEEDVATLVLQESRRERRRAATTTFPSAQSQSGPMSATAFVAGTEVQLVPPLEWLDVHDDTQMTKLRAVLRESPFLMEFYLHEVVFPLALRHTDSKLSASGQDLGGEVLCGCRLGYSGTPNDLLPRALGHCVYAPGDDSQMLSTLADPAVVEVYPIAEEWSAESLLKVVASERPPLNALIDVGALITGLSNEEVAQTLLDFGIAQDAVVFCDQGGEAQVLRRGAHAAVRLAHCALPPEKRFVFYDQIHTTGIDIRHAHVARAALTIGKDSTFRDYAQGAYRMRGIGRGQRLKVLLTPEVLTRVRLDVPDNSGGSGTGGGASGAVGTSFSSADSPTAKSEGSRSRPAASSEDEEPARKTLDLVLGQEIPDLGAEIGGSPSSTVRFKKLAKGSWGIRIGLCVNDQILALNGTEVSSFTNEALLATLRQRPLRLRVSSYGRPLLESLCAWLLLRQAQTENIQMQLLRRQSIEHEARRCAFEVLEQKFYSRKDGMADLPRLQQPMQRLPTSPGNDLRLAWAVDLFCESVSYAVETKIYGSGALEAGYVETYLAKSKRWLDAPAKLAIEELWQPSARNEVATAEQQAQDEEQALIEQRLFAEMEQEHEMELFAEQEQEKEQEEEQEEEEEEEEETDNQASATRWEALKRDGDPIPWDLSTLAQWPGQPSRASPFFPAADLELCRRSDTQRGLCVPFPSMLWSSPNFQAPGGSSSSSSSASAKARVRRLRSPTLVLEWVPDVNRLSSPSSATGQTAVSDSTLEARLRLAFSLMGLDQQASRAPLSESSLSLESFRTLLAALGVEAGAEEELRVYKRVCTWAKESATEVGEDAWIRALDIVLKESNLLELPRNRCYALVSLQEAEAIRIALHSTATKPWLLERHPDCCAALRLLRTDPPELSLLDASNNWVEAPFRWQGRAVAQCLRFLAAEMQFSAKELSLLRHLLRGGTHWQSLPALSPELLQDYFLASYEVRRRQQPAMWMDQPVARLFATDEEHGKAQETALLREVYVRLSEAGLEVDGAFQLLDADGDGKVYSKDIGAKASDLSLPTDLVLRLFEAIDPKRRGYVLQSEWTRAFLMGANDSMVDGAPAEGSSGEPPRPPEGLPLDILRRVSIELLDHTAFTQVWSSEGMQSRKRASIWEADQLVHGIMRVTAMRLSVGHYANEGFFDVKGGRSGGVRRRRILSVKDNRWSGSSSGATTEEILKMVADHYCPCPVKYRHVWCQRRGTPLFIWRPVPPSDSYVALGMVATTENKPPPLTAVRCVMKSFCRPAADPPVCLWDDTGSGGKPASIWIGTSPLATQALWVVPGHNPPHDSGWELAAESIQFDYTGRPSVHVRHEGPAAGSPRAGGSIAGRRGSAMSVLPSTG